MTGRPWYAFYPDAYERDAGHLSYIQDSAYRRMLDLYYKTGEPLPLDHSIVYRSCRAMERGERAAIDYCLGHFFEREEDGYHNARADAEIAKAEGISEKRAEAASGRWGKTAPGTRRQRVENAKKVATHTDEEWRALLAITGFKCLKCGAAGEDVEITKDHIVPVSRGGSDGIGNIQPLCQRCNSSRSGEIEDYRSDAFKTLAHAVQTESNAHAIAEQLDTHTTATSTATPSEAKASSGLPAVRRTPSKPAEVPGFAEFYAAFPLHKSRPAAAKSYSRALSRASVETILDGARRYAESRKDEDQNFTKHPSTWLNNDCWSDEIVSRETPFGARNARQRFPTANDKNLAGAALAIASFSDHDDEPGEAASDRDAGGTLLPFLDPGLHTRTGRG